MSEPRFGKFRGIVIDNVDPSRLGRIRVRTESVAGANPLTWALPCFPVAGDGVGIASIPPVGASVLLEFLDGSVDLPVWVGGFWADGAEVPKNSRDVARDATTMVFESGGVGIMITGAGSSGGMIRLYCGDGPSITLSADGIAISAGSKQVTLDGAPISLNGDALRVD